MTVPRRWFPLWTLDWYILREFLIKYSVLLLVFVILFVLGDVYRDISSFLDSEASLIDILAYLLYKLPGNIRFILPISMLLGCMWCMAAFGKNMEITAMRASGVSLFRCGIPIFCAGVAATAVNIYFNEILVPYTESKAQLIYTMAADGRKDVHHLLAYRSSDGKRHWLFATFIVGGEQRKVTIRTMWSRQLIYALFGKPDSRRFKGRVKRIFPKKSAQILSLPLRERLDALQTELLGRKVDIFANRIVYNSKTREWNFEDGKFISYDKKDEHTAGNGTSAIHQEEFFWKMVLPPQEIPESPTDIANAVREKDDLSSKEILHLLQNNEQMPDRVKCIYRTVFWYRISFPWACLIAVFLGIPLATKNERTGSMLAVISAVIVIVVYIVIAQIFLVFGKSGVIHPVIAGTLPTICFILFGLYRVSVEQLNIGKKLKNRFFSKQP